MNRIDFAVTAGTSEIWTVDNTEGMPHNFHVHDVQYRVVSVNGKEPPVEMQGRQDTVLVKPGDSVRLLVSFGDDYADTATPYMFHCHLFRHEDQGMMGQFRRRPARPPGRFGRAPDGRNAGEKPMSASCATSRPRHLRAGVAVPLVTAEAGHDTAPEDSHQPSRRSGPGLRSAVV